MIDWAMVDGVLKEHAIDDGALETHVADAVLVKSMHDDAVDHGPLALEELSRSILLPFGGPQWPWENADALVVLADEPDFDLQTLLDNLPAGL